MNENFSLRKKKVRRMHSVYKQHRSIGLRRTVVVVVVVVVNTLKFHTNRPKAARARLHISVITECLLQPSVCYNKVFVTTECLLQPSVCYNRVFVTTKYLLQQSICYTKAFVIPKVRPI